MVGMLCADAAQHGRDLRSQFLNRGLFLLTVGHLLIALAESHLRGSLWLTMRGVTVVDEIGLCTFTAAFFVQTLAIPRHCKSIATVGALVLAVAWLANIYWIPQDPAALTVEKALIGGNASFANFVAHAPVLQHVAIYLIGLPLGHQFASLVRREVAYRAVAARLMSIGALLVSAALGLRLVRYALDHLLALRDPVIDLTLKITEKTPPSPGYLMFFGGCAFLLIGILFRASETAGARALGTLRWLAVIGRASLVVFILQYFLYWTLPDLLNLQPNKLAAAFFFFNVLVIRWVAGVWGRLHGNRWMTFGIKMGGVPPLKVR
jgi:hypothetical protein